MNDIAIKCEGLSKQYRIGERERYKALRDVIANAASAPFRRFRSKLGRGLGRGLERGFERGPATANGSSNGNRSHHSSLITHHSPITHHSDRFWALDDVSFEVKPGEVVGIIGRNGAGKSTLLKLLSRITKPTRGHAEIHGRVGSLLEVGTGFHPELTGRENIYLNAAILGMRKAEVLRKFDEIVAFAEVEKFIDTPVKRYSSGMHVRLAFAVAAHLEPEILLVDEVLAVGDAEFQTKCLGKMEEIGNAGRTIIFVSHNMNAIERLCSAAILLDAGRIRAFDANTRPVINQYLFGQHREIKASQWENSNGEFQNPCFRPLRFFIADQFGNKATMPLSNDADFWVQIEGVIETMDPALKLGFALYSEDGQQLFRSYQTDVSPERWPRLQKGNCVLRGKIPRRFLNEGVYRIELLALLHNRTWLLEPGANAPGIFLTIQGGLSDSPLWMVKRPGLIAPELGWTNIEPRQEKKSAGNS